MVNGSSAIIQNSTIAYNTASYGGGISRSLTSGTVTVKNSIIALNSASGAGANCHLPINISSYNIIGDTSGCTVTAGSGDQLNVNPQINEILTGSRQTHALLTGSPAINAGTSTDCPIIDQRGVVRDGACDIGAFEYTIPGSAASISMLSGSGQRAAPTLSFLNPLKVGVYDGLGSPINGVSVVFTAPGSGASGTFQDTNTNTTTVNTNTYGVAISPFFTANSVLGAYIISASTAGVGTTVDFNLQNVTWYVSTTGLDSHSCSTPADPCQTIQGAVTKAVSGDRINVAAEPTLQPVEPRW